MDNNTVVDNTPRATLVLSQDIRPKWLNVIRRLQQAARAQQGLAIIKMAVIVDENGDPVQWTSPHVILFEPKGAKDQFIKLLADIGEML